MSLLYLVGAIVSALLLVYLFLAMLSPESLQ
jgi:K+-transporting ATPase KdpF subunit